VAFQSEIGDRNRLNNIWQLRFEYMRRRSGITDHGIVHSIYFRDPNGYVIELTAKMPGHDQAMNPQTNGARAILDQWQAAKERG
jgi:catechol-2,3-dioxygenase